MLQCSWGSGLCHNSLALSLIISCCSPLSDLIKKMKSPKIYILYKTWSYSYRPVTPVKHCFCSGPRGHEKRDVLRFASLIAASSKVRFDLICAELRMIMDGIERAWLENHMKGIIIKDWPDFTVEIMPLTIYVYQSSKPISISFFLWASLKNRRFFSTFVFAYMSLLAG